LSFLLDTNVLSELRKRERADPGVLGWIHGIDSDELFLSVLVVGELRQGVERVRRRDGNAAAHLERWLDALISQHEDRILGVDVKVAEMWGRLNVPDPLPAVDGLLAATDIPWRRPGPACTNLLDLIHAAAERTQAGEFRKTAENSAPTSWQRLRSRGSPPAHADARAAGACAA